MPPRAGSVTAAAYGAGSPPIMATMQWLTPLDASFLHLERDVAQLNVGSVLLFDGPAPTLADLRREVRALLPLFRRYRQRVSRPPLDLGPPFWADAGDFRLEDHVGEHRLGGSASDGEVRELAVDLISAPLDLDRPLWRTWLVTGLTDDRWAMVSSTHHAMIDGISGTDILGAMLRPTPEPPAPAELVPWSPTPAPSAASLAASGAVGLATMPWRVARRAVGLVQPKRVAAAMAGVYGVARAGEQLARPQFGLTGSLGAARRWAWADAALSDVKAIKAAHGGTVNDVVLAATAGGFRRLLLSRGEPVANRTVRTMVPVSTRHTDERGTLGNRVSAIFADLPVGIEDPVERLHAVSAQLGSLKTSGTALGMDALLGAADLLPAGLFALGVRTWGRLPQRSISTVVTNVPGPQQPLYLLGSRLRSMYPYIPLAIELRITVGVMSYAGRLGWGFTGDAASVPDVAELATGTEQAVADLLATLP